MPKTKKTNFVAAAGLFSNYKLEDKGGHISREFQDFAYRLAVELDDLAHKSLYMRMAKNIDRSILEKARSFIADANAKSKAKLFMWKVKQLREEKKAKDKKTKDKKSTSQNPSQLFSEQKKL